MSDDLPKNGVWKLAGMPNARPPMVTIFGAGVSGLTAAHELVERGFAVQVVDPRGHVGFTGRAIVDVGGMARSHACRIQVSAERLFPFHFGGDATADRYLAAVDNEQIVDPDAQAGRTGASAISEWIVRTLYLPRFQPIPPLYRIPHGVTPDFFDDGEASALEALVGAGELDLILPEVASLIGPLFAREGIDLSQMYAVIARAHAEYEGVTDSLDIQWPADTHWATPDFRARILRRLTMVVQIRVETKDWSTPFAMAIAHVLRQLLLVENTDEDGNELIDDLESQIVIIGPESGFEEGTEEDSIHVDILGREISCDHGYRFFPSSYRNLFDTMRRTPILLEGEETHRSAFDRLVPTPSVDVATENDDAPASIPRKSARSLEELRLSLEVLMKGLGLTARDMLRWDVRMLKFMTSCAARRRDYENESWWDFIGGPDEDGYSKKAKRYLMRTPKALLGVGADHIDARTHAAASTQLLLDHMPPAAAADMTLAGPPSAAWLLPWKEYLMLQGVRFFLGELDRLEEDGDEAKPIATGDGPRGDPLSEDGLGYFKYGDDYHPSFYVFALPYKQGAKIIKPFYDGLPDAKREGDFRRFWKFDEKLGWPRITYRPLTPEPSDSEEGCSPFIVEPEVPEVPAQPPELSRRPSNPLRDLGGIQYFFSNQVRVGKGHVYYPDAPWGLSSISQYSYWRDRPDPGEDFLGQVAVDVGDWDTKGPKLDEGGGEKSAWGSTAVQIVRSVWKQILAGLDIHYREGVEEPLYAHIDRGIRFKPNDGTVEKNWMPYFAALPCQWRLRPGLRDAAARPHGSVHKSPGHEAPTGAVSAGTEIFYDLSHKRWVMAGTHMATYTRMTTMEAANESGRHAVCAILHALLSPGEGVTYEREGTLMGEMPDIWDPEEYELQDLNPLKRLDELLWDENLPHFMDILGVIDETDRGSAVAAVSARARQVGSRDWEFATGIFESLMPQGASGGAVNPELDRLRTIMEQVVRRGGKAGS